MPQWEYKVVNTYLLEVEYMAKHRRKDVPPLDPEIADAAWLALRRCRMAWSDRGCWTPLARCLTELGDAEWELVAVQDNLMVYDVVHDPEFPSDFVNKVFAGGSGFCVDLLFKRPK